MSPDVWAVGDTGYYVLPRAPKNGRPQTLYLQINVINVTKDRVIVRNRVGARGARILKASSLVKTAPDGAWIR